MDEIIENDPGLRGASVRTRSRIHQLRVFLSLCIVVICVRASTELDNICVKQYLYQWCKQYLNKSASTVIVVNKTTNETDSCGPKHSHVKEEGAQKLAAQWEMYIQITSGVLVLVSTSVLGTLSDYTGLKPIGCIAVLGVAVGVSLSAVFIHFRVHFGYFLIGYVVSGISGSTMTFNVIVFSSIASVANDTNDRVVGYAVMYAVVKIAKLIASISSGYFIHSYGFFCPTLTSACGLFLGVIFIVLFLPETKPQRNSSLPEHTNTETTISQQHPTCVTLFKNYVGLYFGRTTQDKTIFRICLIALILLEFTIVGNTDSLTLYQLGSPFCWTSVELGWYKAVQEGISAIVGILILKLLLYCLASDVIACIGSVSLIVFYVFTALARTSLELFIALGGGLLMELPVSIIRGLMSKRTLSDKQGALFASLESLMLLCKVSMAPVAVSIYRHTLDDMKGTFFLILAGVCVGILVLMTWHSVLLRRETRRRELSILNEPQDEDLPSE